MRSPHDSRPTRSTLRLALLLLVGCLLAPQAARADYGVGHVSVHFFDASRGNRDVGVELYYPATATGNGAPVATAPPTGFPIVGFGHGYQMIVQSYANVWEALVPAGFVVALPINEGSLFPNHGNFGADLAFVIASLRAENLNPASILYGKINPKAAVMGHSMGGGASFLAADANPGIDALAVMAPANTNPSSVTAAAGITVPMLIFNGSSDCVASAAAHQIPMYNASASTCKSYVSIAGGSHCQFGVNNTICNLGEIFCGGAGISRATQHDLVDGLLVPWLRAVLETDWQAWQTFEATRAMGFLITSQQSCTVSPAPPPACANGLDDDGDGFTDAPADGGCTSVNDTTEQRDCEDGIDNDGDTAVDSADLGCNLVQMNTENPQCGDGVDNDSDGFIDAADTLCQGPWDADEASNPTGACGLLGPEALLVLAFVGRFVRRR